MCGLSLAPSELCLDLQIACDDALSILALDGTQSAWIVRVLTVTHRERLPVSTGCPLQVAIPASRQVGPKVLALGMLSHSAPPEMASLLSRLVPTHRVTPMLRVSPCSLTGVHPGMRFGTVN